jgi:hypothetical protein
MELVGSVLIQQRSRVIRLLRAAAVMAVAVPASRTLLALAVPGEQRKTVQPAVQARLLRAPLAARARMGPVGEEAGTTLTRTRAAAVLEATA